LACHILKIENWRFGLPNIENSRFGNSRFGLANIKNSRFGIQDFTYQILKIERFGLPNIEIQDLACQILKIEDLAYQLFKIQDLACQILKVQDLGVVNGKWWDFCFSLRAQDICDFLNCQTKISKCFKKQDCESHEIRRKFCETRGFLKDHLPPFLLEEQLASQYIVC